MKRLLIGGLTALAIGLAGAPIAQADGPADEQRFIELAHSIPRAFIPGGWDGALASGYRACAALDRHPNSAWDAVNDFYPTGHTADGKIFYEGQLFLLYSADYLCHRHAHLYENF